MRDKFVRAAIVLACVILVAAAVACPAYAYFSSFTSMFTDVPAPEINHAQAPSLKTSDFLWGSLSSIPGVNIEKTDQNSIKAGTSRKSLFSFNLNTPPATSSNPGWLYTTLTPSIDESNNPAESGYKSMLQRYTNSSWNVFDN